MTISLAHPIRAEQRVADVKAVEAALASLSYWSAPTVPVRTPAKPDVTPLEQMYAYFD